MLTSFRCNTAVLSFLSQPVSSSESTLKSSLQSFTGGVVPPDTQQVDICVWIKEHNLRGNWRSRLTRLVKISRTSLTKSCCLLLLSDGRFHRSGTGYWYRREWVHHSFGPACTTQTHICSALSNNNSFFKFPPIASVDFESVVSYPYTRSQMYSSGSRRNKVFLRVCMCKFVLCMSFER